MLLYSKSKYIFVAISLAAALSASAQTSISFENDSEYRTIGVFDAWEDSPLRNGTLQGVCKIAPNPYPDFDAALGKERNPSQTCLAFQRSRFAGNTYGARIDLTEPLPLSPTPKYVHVLIHKPIQGRIMLMGLGKHALRLDQSAETIQFQELSRSRAAEPGQWQDALFSIKGAEGVEIHSLVVVPDCESPHMLEEDFIVYIDEIVIDDDANQRLQTGWYPVNYEGAYTRSDRHLDRISLSGGADGSQSADIAEPREVYTSLLDLTFHAQAAERLQPGFTMTGSWMNGYVYIDFGNDGAFNVAINADGSIPEGSDIVAFSHVRTDDGAFNSLGETVNNTNVLNPPAFALPADIAPGRYRMRYKTDWADANPAGRNDASNNFMSNGGAIVDVMLNIHENFCSVSNENRNGEVLVADGAELRNVQAPFMKDFDILLRPEHGFRAAGVIIRHGYNLSGERYIFDNPQWTEEYFEVSGEPETETPFTVPAHCMDADVVIEGVFVEKSGLDALMDEDSAASGYTLEGLPASESSRGIIVRRGKKALRR